MLKFPNCKINLGLSVSEKRTDGFHNVETILYPVMLNDALEIVKSPDGTFSFTQTGLMISGGFESNLVVKAYQLLKQEFRLPEVHIHLHKNIPMGAGLGGGSADAAFTIKLLDDVFGLNLTDEKMQDFARHLGSDCPFFIKNIPVLAFEKGDMFEPVSLNLSHFYFTIIKPNVHISTPEAYSWIIPSKKEISLKGIIQQSVDTWKDVLINDFEKEVFKRYPEIELLKMKLYRLGAEYASMTGSGAAVFAFSKKEMDVQNHFPDCFIWQEKGANF